MLFPAELVIYSRQRRVRYSVEVVAYHSSRNHSCSAYCCRFYVVEADVSPATLLEILSDCLDDTLAESVRLGLIFPGLWHPVQFLQIPYHRLRLDITKFLHAVGATVCIIRNEIVSHILIELHVLEDVEQASSLSLADSVFSIVHIHLSQTPNTH